MELELELELVAVLLLVIADCNAVSTACWSAWMAEIWVDVSPMLDSTAVASVWTWVTAALPVKVPLRIASRSSSTCPTDSWVGVAPLDVSLCKAVSSVWRAVRTADIDPLELDPDVEVVVEDVELVELLELLDAD